MACPLRKIRISLLTSYAMAKREKRMLKVAEEIKRGSYDGLGAAASGKILNGIFGEFGPQR